MKIINKSRKIIGINGEPLLPGADLELPEGMETHLLQSHLSAKRGLESCIRRLWHI